MYVCKDFCDRSVICDCLVKGLCNYGEGSMNSFKWVKLRTVPRKIVSLIFLPELEKRIMLLIDLYLLNKRVW